MQSLPESYPSRCLCVPHINQLLSHCRPFLGRATIISWQNHHNLGPQQISLPLLVLPRLLLLCSSQRCLQKCMGTATLSTSQGWLQCSCHSLADRCWLTVAAAASPHHLTRLVHCLSSPRGDMLFRPQDGSCAPLSLSASPCLSCPLSNPAWLHSLATQAPV